MEPAGVATRMPSAISSAMPFALVDQDTQVRRLMGLAKQRDLVDGMMQMHLAMHVGGAHQQRVEQRFLARGEARVQVVAENSFIRKPTVPRCMP